MRIENSSGTQLSPNTQKLLDHIFESLPREHLRGIEKLRLVDNITDPRIRNVTQQTNLPGLYHPRQGTQGAWLEVAMDTLLPRSKPFLKRVMPRISFKGNLAAIIFSLVGQHYYLTMRHSIKRGQLEAAVRVYTDKQLRAWQEQQHSLRARIFKPLQPTFERWARSLQKKASAEKKKAKRT